MARVTSVRPLWIYVGKLFSGVRLAQVFASGCVTVWVQHPPGKTPLEVGHSWWWNLVGGNQPEWVRKGKLPSLLRQKKHFEDIPGVQEWWGDDAYFYCFLMQVRKWNCAHNSCIFSLRGTRMHSGVISARAARGDHQRLFWKKRESRKQCLL